MRDQRSTGKPAWWGNIFAWMALMFLWFAIWNAETARAYPFVAPVFLAAAVVFAVAAIRHRRHASSRPQRSQNAHH